MESRAVVVALVAIAAVAALVVIAARWGATTPARSRTSAGDGPREGAVLRREREQLDRPAAGGAPRRLHVTVYRNAPTGRLLYDGTLDGGQSRCFVGRRVWFQATKPENLTARVNGRLVRLPRSRGGPLVAVANQRGIAPTSS